MEPHLSTPAASTPGHAPEGLDSDTPALIVQVTDPHLLQTSGVLLGVDTEASLRAVLQQVARDQGRPDLLLATGDLSQDGTPQSYRRFASMVRELQVPVRCLPGNHDAPGVLKDELQAWTAPVTDVRGWRIVLLDSTVPGSNAGHLARSQLDLLDHALSECGGRPALVALHHNVAPASVEWHDSMMLDNAPDLFRRLGRWTHVRVLLWGHVHQEFDRRRGSMRMLATPSTCFQFAIRDGRHGLDDSPPGYRWLKLYRDGSLATGVRRLDPRAWQIMRQDWTELEQSRAA
jgi:Icc protein